MHGFRSLAWAVLLLAGSPAIASAACPAGSAHYRLSGNPRVGATLGELAQESDSLSDLYVRIEAAPGDILWFTMDRGSGHRGATLHSSRHALDRPLPAGEQRDYAVRGVTITFFDAAFAEVQGIVRSGDAAPLYFFLSDTDWPRNPGEAPERRTFPAQLGSAMFVLERCGEPARPAGADLADRGN